MTWRSIKDDPPPKDGTEFLALCEADCGSRNHWIVRWEWVPYLGEEAFVCGSDAEGLTDLGPKGPSTLVSCLAYWMPLPEPPDA